MNCPTCNKNFKPKSNHQKYCSKSCSVKAQHQRGEIGFEKSHVNWKGGIRIDKRYGYILIWKPEHPLAHKDGYVYEHRLKMQNELFDGAIVHHRDGNASNNERDNLEIVTRGQHNKIHIRNPLGKKTYAT
jgi:flagellar basal body rod protein FlgC